MSRSVIAPKKSSKCCIGCVVMLIIVIGLSVALGIYMYRFAKENIALVNVSTKADPPLDTPAEELLPATVGEFERKSLLNTLDSVPQWKDLATTGTHLAVYENATGNQITVIAASTAATRQQRESGTGLLTFARPKANAPDTGITIKDPFSTSSVQTITTWSKPNWTFMVQTDSPQMPQFLENFFPGGNQETTGSLAAEPAEPAPAPPETATTAPEQTPAIDTVPVSSPPAATPTPEPATPPVPEATTVTL